MVPSRPVIPFVTAEQQNGCTSGIKDKDDAQKAATWAQFPHIVPPRSSKCIDPRTGQGWPVRTEALDGEIHTSLVAVIEPIVPGGEFVSALDLPHTRL